MNIMTSGLPVKSESETGFPLVSGNRKLGAAVPSGNIVELTATMMKFGTRRANFRVRMISFLTTDGHRFRQETERRVALQESKRNFAPLRRRVFALKVL